jgi:hypothetical protein
MSQKVKVVLDHDMKVSIRSGGIAPFFMLDEYEWSTSWPRHFISGKEPRYTLNRRLGGPQN